ncbi:Alpha/Beta hydrolase protein [Cristinia sonorae]|uniref:Carboxylic ester hydrolase n=1 Tax=Cristinia sonorae TaxID=1940300 RepID=A0A8K0XQT6_9AGAR|nr:Alpha/Beta hydrolase protein [Cristinia sonorae]
MKVVTKPIVAVHHTTLNTTFHGLTHHLSTPESPISQFLGVKYADVPARFRQSRLHSSYPAVVDATHHGPICPQSKYSNLEAEMFGLSLSAGEFAELLPKTPFEHDEFECLNLNITTPAGASSHSNLPVMLWIHGGGNRGSGSSWLYDGGSLVRKSIETGKPIVLVTINYRLGLLGFASSPQLKEDNKAAGDEGVGNYGLRDQRTAMEWVHNYIAEFGGDPSNVTLFGESTGAADILCHLHSNFNEHMPLFRRVIMQSPMLELDIPTVHSAGWQLSRTMGSLNIHTVDDLRTVEVEKLIAMGLNVRAVDDGFFFSPGWKAAMYPPEAKPATHHVVNGHLDIPELELLAHHPDHRRHYHHRTPHSHSRSRSASPRATPTVRATQPIMIGDCGAESLQWTLPASLWTGAGLVRRLRAICQSLPKSTALLRAYDITSYTPADELCDHVLELINDARFAWPTECIARYAKQERGGKDVWRYVFDQESPSRGVPHNAVDLMYLFDTVPLPTLASATPPDSFAASPMEVSPAGSLTPSTPDMCFGSGSESSEDEVDITADGRVSPDYGFGAEDARDDEWGLPIVDTYSYNRVRDAIQTRWITFAYGEAPWSSPSTLPSASASSSSATEKVYVFGPEGETGERSMSIFDGRRRRKVWKEALEPLGMGVVQKVAVELCNGPPESNSGLVKVKVKANLAKMDEVLA